ncbi:MAG: hypothetical protein HY587_01610, partial [Candidatus Omnitrophica bacterium]|nr:hypothetical protein [Candidatus Omnitrophota bacterium]
KTTTVDIRYDTVGGAGGYPVGQTIATLQPVANGTAGVTWGPIPDAIGTNVKVKVFDAAFTDVFGESPAFKIMGGLTLTGPTGGVTKTATTDTDVTWNFNGTIPNVNVYYDANTTDGIIWILVGTKNQTGCTGSCSYSWTTLNTPVFPSTVGNNYRIKITNAADETDVLSEGTDFKIGAQFDVTFPENGAPVYAEDVNTNITWTTPKGSGINKIHLYYSNSDLSTSAVDPTTLGWIQITPALGIANNGSYTWNPIPRGLTELSTVNHRVLITQYDPANQDQVFNVSGGTVFPILGKLIVTTPSTGSESWGVNTTQTIKFKKQGNLQSAELYYSYDGAALNYVKIKRADLTTVVDISDATGVPDALGNYSFPWFLDPAITSLTSGFSGRIKAKAVTPSTQTSVESLPSTAIEVKGTVTVRAPGGVDDPTPLPMEVGQSYLIKWDKFGAVNNIQIHYSTAGCGVGNNFDTNPIIFDGASTPSSFNWTVPNNIGTNVCIRVRHKENTNVNDVSDVVFRIKGKLQLTEPEAAGLSYTVGTTQTIRWTTTGTFTPVELHYDKDGNFATTADTFPVLPFSTVTNCSPVSPAITCTATASFTIEDKISAATKLRVRGTGADSDVVWISTNPFKIVGALDVTAPEAGQLWYVGETNRVITWDATGTVTNVNIGYKTSAGASCNYTAIAANDAGHVAGANTFNWTAGVADEKTETAYICIQDTNFTEITNVSAAPFSIRPLLTVTSPVAAQRVVVGSNNAGLVKWTRTGTKTTTIDIKYDTNDGKGADGIAGNADDYAGTIATLVDASTGATGVAWNGVPDSISNLVRVKVVDNSASLVFAVSPATFKIVGSLTFSEPLAGTYLNVGQTGVLIKWTKSGSFANVNIWYSTDGGTNFTTEITPSTSAALLQYSWPSIPATPSNNVVIRIADTGDPETKALSGVLHIHRVYDITQPESGEVLAVGTSYDIKWNTTGGTAANVKLQYATNGGGAGGNWVDIPGATNLVNTNPGSFAWTVPDAVSSQVKVRVVDLSDTDNWNESGTQNNPLLGTFKIRADLRMVSPNGNVNPNLTDKLLVGSTSPIQWFLNGTMSTVKLQLSVGGGAYADITGATALNAAGGQTGCAPSPCWNWTIPNNISQQVRVRVVNEADTTVLDSSDFDFAIRGGFTWSYPTVVGTVFNSGETKTVTWTTTGSMANVNLEYSTNNGSSYAAMLDSGGLPATNIINTGTFNWPVPTNVVSKDVFVRITGTNDPNSKTDTVKIKIAGVLNLSAPVGGARWGANTTQQIKWTTTGPIANIKIEHSLNGGTSWVTPAIADTVAATGQAGCTPAPCFNWLVPTTTSPNVVIRLGDVITDSGTTAVVSSVFKIVGSFSFTAPIATTIWPVTTGEIANTTQNIVWSTIGGVAQVNIRYSATGVAPWTFVVGPLADGGLGGSYAWTVPDAVGNTVKVLIEDATDPYPNTYTESAAFTVRGDLKFTAPVGGEKWGVAGGVSSAYKTISWQRNGTIAQVYLDYSKSGAAGPWIAILNATSGLEHPNSGSFAWDVPNDMTLQGRIRIRNVSGPAVESISPTDFKIMARFDVMAPDGGEILQAGQNYTMTWNKWGTAAANVKIELALNGNVGLPTYDKLIALSTPNDGNHPFTVDPNWITPNGKIRIYDVNDIDSVDASFSTFAIRAVFTFVEPVATTPDLQVGQPFLIVWAKQGNIANVKLEYSPGGNNFLTDIRPIEPTTDGIVPNTNAAGCNPTEGCHSWTVPDVEDNKDENIKLRIRDPNDAGAEVISVPFRIIPKFALTFPNGNADASLTDKLKVGHRVGDTATPYTITWTSSSSQIKTPFVVLRYSTDGGGTWPAGKVIANTDNDGSYVWTTINGGVPDDISSQVRIRVEDASDGVGKDDSNFNVKIISNFKLNAPNGGAVYEVSDPLTATWESIGTAANVEIAYSTGGAGFTSPVVILATTLNDATEAWPSGVSDAISSTVRVRVKSLTDDGFDISDTDFRIRGKLAVTAPGAGARLAIGQPYTITWTATGTIPNVNIKYDINDGKGTDGIAGNADDYPYTIATSAAGCTPVSPALTCSSSFNWLSVPDTATALARIKIIDSRASESDVIGISLAFNIIGNFTLLAPNGNEDWRVNTTQTIRFNWGGTMANVDFYYTKNMAVDPATIPTIDWISIGSANYGLGDGSGTPLPERTFSWLIPNDISPNVRVKVAFAGDSSVYDVSNNFFKIRGSFTLTTPNGNTDVSLTDRWVTFDQKTIQWTTTGGIPNIKLQYSSDGFLSDINTIGTPTITNCTAAATPPYQCTGTFSWVIPDRVLKNGSNFTVATDLQGTYPGPNMVKVRVTDVNDLGVYDESDNLFKIDYYKTTWDIRDLLTNAPLSGLTVKVVKDTDPNYIIWNQAGVTTSPAVVKYFPFGTWVATWTKTEYTDMSVTVNASQDRDYSASPLGPLFMQTSTVHIWESISQVSYNADADTLGVVSWLMRDGSRVPGPIEAFYKIIDQGTVIATLGSPTAANPKSAIVGTGWEGSTATPPAPHEPALPDSSGYFKFTLAATTGLQAGKVYVGEAQIKIGTGGVFKTPISFEVSTAKTLEEVKDLVNSQLNKPLSQVEAAVTSAVSALINAQTSTIQAQLNTQTTTIDTKMSEQTTAIKATLNSFETTVSTSVASLKAGADQSLAAAAELEATALRHSWKAGLSPNPALLGDTITIQAQGVPGKFPIISVYNHLNKEVVASGALVEDPAQPGNYNFSFKVNSGDFTAGKAFTYIVSEDVTGGLTAGSGFVESSSLTSIAGLAASAPGAESAAKQALDAIRGLEAIMSKGGDVSGVKDTVRQVQTAVNEIPALIAKAMDRPDSPMAQMKGTVEDIQRKLKELAGKEGFDFKEIFKQSLSDSPDIKEIRQVSDSINDGVAVMNAVVKAKLGGTDEPIVMSSYSSGSVVLRVVAVNPSDKKPQDIPIKIYLPQEAMPHDILNKGDLELGYDSEKSQYFVFKDKVTLAAKETKVFEVELEDIWFVADDTLKSLRTRTEHIIERLKDTDYYESAGLIAQTIYGRVDQITVSQADESINKELHIGMYRSNMKIVERIKEDIGRLEKILVAVGAPPAPDILAESKLNLKTPSKATTWFIILAILVFIGLLGAVFFFTWQSQVKLFSDLSSKSRSAVFPELDVFKHGTPQEESASQDESG